MVGKGAMVPQAPSERTGASLLAASVLVLLIFGFVALLSFGRGVLALQLMPGVSVYVAIMVALTLVIWGLSWAYMRRTNQVERRGGGRDLP